ncbi:MAG: histidine kinase [Propionivibrio sp.]|nr:histidine kinase [Propionivibrio sp.]
MKKYAIYLAATLTFNTAIAGVMTILMPSVGFLHNMIFAQCIGISISTISCMIAEWMPNGMRKIVSLIFSLPISVAIGLSLAYIITGDGGWHGPQAWQSMAIGLFFGVIGAIAYMLADRLAAETKHRQLIKSESEKREIEAHLKLLQAQIEPHFLFNTLANVSSLIHSNPALAKDLLERLNDWLRVALLRTRSIEATLGDELVMLENYLAILKIRFGERLRWRIEAPDRVRRIAFPPMLLQPLVENAIRHGIEPKVGGGEIRIVADVEESALHIEVSDDGMGLAVESESSSGAGLANVRARLAALYGEDGRLALHGNAAGGATTTLVLPEKERSA